VSKKLIIIMDKREDKNVASTSVETGGISAQDRYCARSSGRGTMKRRDNKEG